MSGPATRRGFVALGIFFVAAIVLLLLGHHALTGYVEKSHAAAASASPPAADGASGTVRFADGAPASSARVVVEWRDSADRPGETRALPDSEGRFRVRNVPPHAKLGDVRAWIGPLGASGVFSDAGAADLALPKEFALRGRVRSTAAGGAPVLGATLVVGGVSGTTDEAGGFRMSGISAAAVVAESFALHVEAPGFRTLDWPLSLDDRPETYQDLTVRMEPVK